MQALSKDTTRNRVNLNGPVFTFRNFPFAFLMYEMLYSFYSEVCRGCFREFMYHSVDCCRSSLKTTLLNFNLVSK